jgi:hypothetical protein
MLPTRHALPTKDDVPGGVDRSSVTWRLRGCGHNLKGKIDVSQGFLVKVLDGSGSILSCYLLPLWLGESYFRRRSALLSRSRNSSECTPSVVARWRSGFRSFQSRGTYYCERRLLAGLGSLQSKSGPRGHKSACCSFPAGTDRASRCC